MRISRIVPILVFAALSWDLLPVPAHAQRRSSAPAGGRSTFAIAVTDSAGTPLGDVSVSLSGPESRSGRTERGRVAFENLRAGLYRIRFDREGFISLEREVAARGVTPIDVKVTLTAAPAPPPPPPAPAPPPPPPVKTDPVIADVPGFLEENFVGRAPSKISPIGCAGAAAASLVQLREPRDEGGSAEIDEYVYVIGGEGTIRIVGAERPLKAGVFVMIPRGVAQTIVPKGRNPLVLLSIKAGRPCT